MVTFSFCRAESWHPLLVGLGIHRNVGLFGHASLFEFRLALANSLWHCCRIASRCYVRACLLSLLGHRAPHFGATHERSNPASVFRLCRGRVRRWIHVACCRLVCRDFYPYSDVLTAVQTAVRGSEDIVTVQTATSPGITIIGSVQPTN